MGIFPSSLRGPLRPGIAFRPFPVVSVETVSAPGASPPVVRITFALESEDAELGFEQPYTHVKIRRPDSWFRSRTYSIVTPANTKGSFAVCVKVYPGGTMSGYLASLRPGDVAYIARTRTKTLRTDPGARVALVAFGIGAAEMPLTAQRVLEAGGNVLLILANRTRSDAWLFSKEWHFLASKYPETFSLVHVISRPEVPSEQDGSKLEPELIGTVVEGRLSKKILGRALNGLIDAYLVIGRKVSMQGTWVVIRELDRGARSML
ncbi:hypothetical protein DFJ74DRAFT_671377 [Hyaloraphidium curvatum]|nr:hypothetical protein DFJ74DRAFT_671377 [Hyaloraphidium curvatum]